MRLVGDKSMDIPRSKYSEIPTPYCGFQPSSNQVSFVNRNSHNSLWKCNEKGNVASTQPKAMVYKRFPFPLVFRWGIVPLDGQTSPDTDVLARSLLGSRNNSSEITNKKIKLNKRYKKPIQVERPEPSSN